MNFQWTTRSCPLCGGTKEARVVLESNIAPAKFTEFAFASRKVPEYMHPRMVECADCCMLYGNPVLPLETILQAYHEAAFDSQEESAFASITYRKLLKTHLPGLSARKSALDIGAGDGSFLEQLLLLGFREVTGVEPSAAPIAASKPEIRKHIRHGCFRVQDFEPDQFDLVTCFQVLEHLWDPAGIARDAFRILRPGGMFCVVVHNREALSARLLGARSPIFDVEHLQLFCPATIAKLLQRTGFVNIQRVPVWNRYPLHYWMKLAPLPRGLKEFSIKASKQIAVGNIPFAIPAGNLAAMGYKP